MFAATIVGGDEDPPGSSVVEFGRCDADGTPIGAGRLVIPHGGLLLRIQDHGAGDTFGFKTIGIANNPQFPGPGETRGILYDSALNNIGTIGITTRIAGQCPPAGNSHAYYRLTVRL
jgi:hypothetical protein